MKVWEFIKKHPVWTTLYLLPGIALATFVYNFSRAFGGNYPLWKAVLLAVLWLPVMLLKLLTGYNLLG